MIEFFGAPSFNLFDSNYHDLFLLLIKKKLRILPALFTLWVTGWLQLARLAELQEKLEAMSLSTGEGPPSPLRLLSGIRTPRYIYSKG